MSHLLAVEDLVVDFGNTAARRRGESAPAVDGVALHVDQGECLGLVGESGSGKSTIARTIVGLVHPTRGRVTLAGIEVPGASKDEARTLHRTVQMIFQDPQASLNPRMTVGDLVGEAVELGGDPKGGLRSHIGGLLEEVGLKADYIDRYPAQLSGGEGQRVAIARAIAVRPRLLICDEPTSALDVSVQASILLLFQQLQRDGDMSLLFITHDLGVVSAVADRVLVLSNGRLVEEGPTHSVLASPTEPYTIRLVEAASTPELDALTSGEQAPAGTGEAPGGGPLLDISGLSVRYDGSERAAVDDISMAVWPGERVGIIGESGSGKTTLGRAALRLLDAKATVAARSKIVFGETDLLALDRRGVRRFRGSRIAPIFQNPSSALNPSIKVGRQLTALARMHRGLRGEEARRLAVESLREAELRQPEAVMGKYPHQLSGGMCQRTFVAMALICGPQLVIADEPTSALDVTVQDTLLTTLERLNRDHSMTFLLITHDMGVIARFCDRVYVMKEGRVVEHGAVEKVFARPRDPYTKSLLAATPRIRDGAAAG